MKYDEIGDAVRATGMRVRGGFVPVDADEVPPLADGRTARTVVVIGNIGGEMWPAFRAADPGGANPLDAWTRSVLTPIAVSFDATFVHPSDEPFQPFQRWARRADDVWQSPIGLLIHPRHGLWHALRGAFLIADDVEGLPVSGGATSPCLECEARPCLSTCPVEAFTTEGYDTVACAEHVTSGREPTCLSKGCAARLACPVGAEGHYGADQMRFHMEAFAGARR